LGALFAFEPSGFMRDSGFLSKIRCYKPLKEDSAVRSEFIRQTTKHIVVHIKNGNQSYLTFVLGVLIKYET
jgi:hypothetical protein